jgi:Flp pilus assembly protein TadG
MSQRRALTSILRAGRALRHDTRATAAVEGALILPIAMTMFALLLYGAEAFNIQRKVTLTARTVTDLITQATPTQFTSGASIVSHTSIDTQLGVSSSVLTPYTGANLTMVVSEVQVNSDQVTATVLWSEPYNGATARTLGQQVTLPTGMGTGQYNTTTSQGSFMILGEVFYSYTPLNFYTPVSAMTLHDSIYLTPRQSTSITCTDCTTHS